MFILFTMLLRTTFLISLWLGVAIVIIMTILSNKLFLAKTYTTTVKQKHNESKSLKYPRILCMVITSPKNHMSKAIHVKATWGKRCEILLFVSSEADPRLNAINLTHGNDTYNTIWGKTREGFKFVYDKYRDLADWFLKADDDTYVIVDNLRAFLATQKETDPIYFGCRYAAYVKQGYMSGGAGYVLSKEALQRYANQAYTNASLCRSDWEGAEDVEMGKCMENIQVTAGDSRDGHGRGRFFPFSPPYHLDSVKQDNTFWIWKAVFYPLEQGPGCCSDTAISFHYVTQQEMHLIDYLLYTLKVQTLHY